MGPEASTVRTASNDECRSNTYVPASTPGTLLNMLHTRKANELPITPLAASTEPVELTPAPAGTVTRTWGPGGPGGEASCWTQAYPLTSTRRPVRMTATAAILHGWRGPRVRPRGRRGGAPGRLPSGATS